jgi:hypothetical protein
MKTKKKKKYLYPVIITGLAVTLFAIFTVKADGGSIIDRIVNVAGQIVGNNINQQINDSGAINTISEGLIGATPGTDHYNAETFWAGFAGKTLATTTTATTMTLTEKDINPYTAIEVIPTVGSLTYTLPATSTLNSILKNIGDTREWTWQNATTATAINLTIAAGAGWNLSGVDANVDVIPGAAYTARELVGMFCYRQANRDINCEIRENIAAD